MIERLDLIEKRYEEINNLLMQNEVISDIKRSRELSIELSNIEETGKKYREYKKIVDQEIYVYSKPKSLLQRIRIKYFTPNTNAIYLCRKMWYLYSRGGGK